MASPEPIQKQEKAKGHPEGWPECLLCLAPRPSLEPGTCGSASGIVRSHVGSRFHKYPV